MLDNVEIQAVSSNPVYRQIASVLKEHIVSGRLPKGSQLPPEPELAAKFGTTRLTLRKSLKILEAQRLLVQRKGCGTFVTFEEWAPRHIAVTGINLSETQSFSLRILAGLMQAAQGQPPCQLTLLEIGGGDAGNGFLQKYNESGCDGLIVSGADDRTVEALCAPAFASIPIVFLNGGGSALERNGKASVDLAPGTMELAVAHLHGLGHRRIAYISNSTAVGHFIERNECFRRLVAKYGLHCPEGYINDGPNDCYWYEMGRKTARRLCLSDDPPTALVCASRSFAYGAWQGVAEAGRKIPEDVSLIGFDCEADANPFLTTLEQPLNEMADKAMALLLGQIDTGKLPSPPRNLFPARLVERGSCAKIQRGEP